MNSRLQRILVVLLVAACGDEPATTSIDPVSSGTLAIEWSTPQEHEGAVLLTITGPGIGELTSSHSDVLVFARRDGMETRVAVLGEIGSGRLLKFEVPDVQQAGRYEVSLIEVADVDGELRSDLAAYDVAVVR